MKTAKKLNSIKCEGHIYCGHSEFNVYLPVIIFYSRVFYSVFLKYLPPAFNIYLSVLDIFLSVLIFYSRFLFEQGNNKKKTVMVVSFLEKKPMQLFFISA